MLPVQESRSVTTMLAPSVSGPHSNPLSVAEGMTPLGWLWQRRLSLITLVVSYALCFYVRDWQEFVDESDNLLGGYLISRGWRLYRDYFSHHMPLPYYLAAIPSVVGISSLDGYRTFTSLVVLAFWGFILLRFRSRLPEALLCLLVAALAIAQPAYWGHMLLAENLLAYALLVLVLYVVAYPSLDFARADQVAIALCAYVALMSTLIAAYPLIVLAAFYAWQRVRAMKPSSPLAFVRDEAGFTGIVLLPYLLTLAALFASGTFADFVNDAITFNRVYYSQFTLDSQPAAILVDAALNDARYVRDSLHPISFGGIDGLLLVANLVATVLIARKRGIAHGLFYGALLVTSRMRADFFHNQPYDVLSILSLVIALAAMFRATRARWLAGRDRQRPLIALPTAVLAGRVVLVVGSVAFVAWALVFFGRTLRDYPIAHASRFQPASYAAYVGIVDTLTGPGDTVWIAPLDPYAYLAVGRLPATEYAFYLPWQSASTEINQRLISDLKRTRPPVIIYHRNMAIWYRYALRDYGRAVYAYIQDQYVVVDERDPLWGDVFLRKDRSDELLRHLKDAGVYPHPGASQFPAQ